MTYSHSGSRDPTRQLSSIMRASITPHEERCSSVEGIDVLHLADGFRAVVKRRNRRAQHRQGQGGSYPFQWSCDYRPRRKRRRELFYRWVLEGFRKSSRLSHYQDIVKLLASCRSITKPFHNTQKLSALRLCINAGPSTLTTTRSLPWIYSILVDADTERLQRLYADTPKPAW